MKYKAIIADIDGTIIEPSEYPAPPPSRRLVETVKKAKEKGVIFSMASGRSLAWVENLIKDLDIGGPIILDNGARIYDVSKGEYVWQSFLGKKEAQKVLSILTKDKSLRIFVTDDGNRLGDLKDIKKWKISKILVLGVSPGKAEELYQKLKVIPLIHVTKSVSGVSGRSESIHVTNHDATKQIAVVQFAKLLGISTKKIIGIGDSYNDFPLLLACGLKVAMENAVADLKEIADYIAPSYKDDGVAHVIEKFILADKDQNHSDFHDTRGERKEQILVLSDRRGNPKGFAEREDCHKGRGKTHLAFMGFVFDRTGSVILAKRSKKKTLWGGFWDATVVSHVLPGETPEQAVNRRSKEEIGLDLKYVSIGGFFYFAKYKDYCENEYCYVLLSKTDKKVIPNPIEIDKIQTLSLKDLIDKIRTNPQKFTPWLKKSIEKFDIDSVV